MTSLFIFIVFQAFRRAREKLWTTASRLNVQRVWLITSTTDFPRADPPRDNWQAAVDQRWNVTGMSPEHFLSAADHLAEPTRPAGITCLRWNASEVRGQRSLCDRVQEASDDLKGHYVVLEKKLKL